jgi:hypothetical protein
METSGSYVATGVHRRGRRIQLSHGASLFVGNVLLDEGTFAVGIAEQLSFEEVNFGRQGVVGGVQVSVLALRGLFAGSKSRGFVTLRTRHFLARYV